MKLYYLIIDAFIAAIENLYISIKWIVLQIKI